MNEMHGRLLTRVPPRAWRFVHRFKRHDPAIRASYVYPDMSKVMLLCEQCFTPLRLVDAWWFEAESRKLPPGKLRLRGRKLERA